MPKYVVIHPSLNLRVNKRLQEMEVGTVLDLPEETAAGLVARGFIEPQKAAKEINLSGDTGDEKDGAGGSTPPAAKTSSKTAKKS